MAIRFAPPSAPAIKPVKSTTPKPEKAKPVKAAAPAESTTKRGRKPADDPRRVIGIRLPVSLIADLDDASPNWKAQIEPLLRRHFGL